jgi:phosphate transport system protein
LNRLIDVVLEDQAKLLYGMGELTYQTLSLSLKAYVEGSMVQKQVQEMSDRLMVMADQVEARTFELIARFQPVASDLRTIKSYMKISYDFARYGRYALDISFINDQFSGIKVCDSDVRLYIEEMSAKVLQMVATSVDALRRLDIDLARSISQTEQEVDQMYIVHMKKLFDEENISNNKCIVSSALMVRYLERIADHAVYVCESILYIVTGEKSRLR